MLFKRISNRIARYQRRRGFKKWLLNWSEADSALNRHTLGATLSLRNGFILRGRQCDDTAGIFAEIFLDLCYTPAWFYNPNPQDCAVDIGANIGIFSTFLQAVAPGLRTYAFEPHPDTHCQLLANLDENRCGGVVFPYPVAVAAARGIVRFHRPGSPLESGHQAARAGGDGIPVEAIGLLDVREIVAAEYVDILKIDTEGAEAEIVSGAPPSFWKSVRRVVVEYHDLAKRDSVISVLSSAGYTCRVLPFPGFEHHLGTVYAWRP